MPQTARPMTWFRIDGRVQGLHHSVLAFLLEIFFVEQGIDFYPMGSMNQEPTGQAFTQAALSTLDIELLTRCVLLAETSRLEAARVLRPGIQSPG